MSAGARTLEQEEGPERDPGTEETWSRESPPDLSTTEGERERDRKGGQTERETARERETDQEKDREADRQRERQIKKETN